MKYVAVPPAGLKTVGCCSPQKRLISAHFVHSEAGVTDERANIALCVRHGGDHVVCGT